jgi:hypothetical protein
MAPASSRALLNALALVGILVLASEILSFAAGKLLVHLAMLYDPPQVENYAGYLADRDPVVGWPGRSKIGHGEIDSGGSRIVPEFPDPATPSCAALFGDSFTWGAEVPPEHAYGNVLAGQMRCRVANYGVPGYGTDQAYLRYARVINDKAPIVILGHYSDNIIRNINQERGFLTNQIFGLKPRFVLEADGLKLIPLPSPTEAEYLSLRSRAQQLLPYDYFAPGGPSGIRSFGFPYTLSALGAVQHYRVQARLRRQPSYAQFYDPEHPARALQITEAIIKAFAREARARKQKPMVLLIPDDKDLRWLRDRGTLPYGELANRLRNADIAVVDVGEELNKDSGIRDLCEIFMHCEGHFTPAGYMRFAEITFAKLKALGWIQTR